MSEPMTDRENLRAELLAAVDQMVDALCRPSDLYELGQIELIEQYGDVSKVPIEASAKNATMEAGYNAVPDAIVEVLSLVRDIAIRHVQPTGMQMSFTDGMFFAKSIEFDGPMHIVKADRFLYPQYDGKVTEWAQSDNVRQWLAQQAQTALLETKPLRSPEVTARLEALAVSPKDVEVRL